MNPSEDAAARVERALRAAEDADRGHQLVQSDVRL